MDAAGFRIEVSKRR